MHHWAGCILFYGLMLGQSLGALTSCLYPWHQIRGEQGGARRLQPLGAENRLGAARRPDRPRLDAVKVPSM